MYVIQCHGLVTATATFLVAKIIRWAMLLGLLSSNTYSHLYQAYIIGDNISAKTCVYQLLVYSFLAVETEENGTYL